MNQAALVFHALQRFAQSVGDKTSQLVTGAPEDQLRSPFEQLLAEVGELMQYKLVLTGESPLEGRVGRPDYAVSDRGLLVGYVELKAPGTGADYRRFRGHNLEQFNRFAAVPNILYTDGNEWALYRNGELVGRIVRLEKDICAYGKNAVTRDDAEELERLLFDFLSWKPQIPIFRSGIINLKEFAELLAPLCAMIRDDVHDALSDPTSAFVRVATDWRTILFRDASDEHFADAYAQTVTFALLLGRSEGAEPLTIENAVTRLAAKHTLLSRTLDLLTQPELRQEIHASLAMLLRVLSAVPPRAFERRKDNRDPWLYFYEDFLAAYDPKLRRSVGVYYTPSEVVQAQVRLVDDLLRNELGKPSGFGEPDVITLDPAVGTGTYLISIINHTLDSLANYGPGAIPSFATDLAKRLIGFEIMVGPYAVAELRVSRSIMHRGGELPEEGLNVLLADTLEDPFPSPIWLPYMYDLIGRVAQRARHIKAKVPVLVCIGNPPYGRHEAAETDNKASTGGWVRWGYHETDPRYKKYPKPILDDFVDPAIEAGNGVHVKHVYNLYVYFWRWALWKVFEHESASGPGIVSFITASSYLDGPAFVGMREHMRRVCDKVWIIDLGGEGRGTRREENVFDIQVPVAIAIAFRRGAGNPGRPARVTYARIRGSRKEKLRKLAAIEGFDSLEWQECPHEWQAPFYPQKPGAYFEWPDIRDLMPWRHSGVQFVRTWPIAPDVDTLKRRWRTLLADENLSVRARLFRETRDRKIEKSYSTLFDGDDTQPIYKLPVDASVPRIERYAYRSFDRMWLIADNRVGDNLRRVLWRVHSDKQIYLTGLFSIPLDAGPALSACAYLPDYHHFRGSYGGKDVFPLYRDPDASEPNITPELLDLLSSTYGFSVTPEDWVAYLYAVLAHPHFTFAFYDELESLELRVPITKDGELFKRARDIGRYLLWLHTYGERYVPDDMTKGVIPKGTAMAEKTVSGDPDHYPESFDYDEATDTLRVGDGVFRPVSKDVYEFEISGLKVVQSWLGYRMKQGSGKKSSDLDKIRPERWTSQFTRELLELLWVLEATIAVYPKQRVLLDEIIRHNVFSADEISLPPDYMREEPTRQTTQMTFEGF